jgi:hypothetical protein
MIGLVTFRQKLKAARAASAAADRRRASLYSPFSSVRNLEQAWPQADQADQDQINCHDVIEQARYEEDQYTGDKRDQWLYNDDVKGHLRIPG